MKSAIRGKTGIGAGLDETALVKRPMEPAALFYEETCLTGSKASHKRSANSRARKEAGPAGNAPWHYSMKS